MAEFVTDLLESYSSAFRTAQELQLLSSDEVKLWIQRFRRHAYGINKRVRKPTDYLKYGESLRELLELLAERRKREKLDSRQYLPIVTVFQHSGRKMYKMCADRFKHERYFRIEIDYLKSVNMHVYIHNTFDRMLRIHGHNPRVQEEAAKFEFDAGLFDQSRKRYQLAVRRFPEDESLWLSFFEMEIDHVLVLLRRRAEMFNADDSQIDFEVEPDPLAYTNPLNEGKKEPRQKKTNDPVEKLCELRESLKDDPIYDYKLAEIVATEGYKALKEKSDAFLINCYQFLSDKGKIVRKISETIYGMIDKDKMKSEEKQEKDGCHSKKDREEVEKLTEKPLTAVSLSLDCIRKLEKQKVDINVIKSSFENLVVQHGNESVISWIEYGRFILEHKPLELSHIYQRASVNLNKDIFEEFAVNWDQMIREMS